ncbi:hypothetical protein IKE67_03775 [bacterium]|nr:hypothetical protein [bacterium]
MISNEDLIAETELYFKQIISMLDLMITNANFKDMPNLITLKELAEIGLNKLRI